MSEIAYTHDVIFNHVVKEEIKEENLVLLAKRNRSRSTASGVVAIIFGVLLFWLLIGFALIVLGSFDINRINKSNAIKRDCVYYYPEKKMLIFYEWNGNVYMFEPKDVKSIIVDSANKVAVACVIIDGHDKNIYLGLSTYEEIEACKAKIAELKEN